MSDAGTRRQRWLASLGPHIGTLVGLLLFALALIALRSLLHKVDPRDVGTAIMAMPGGTIALAALSVAGSYAFLIGYDASALRYIGRRVPAATMAIGSFCAYAMGNTVGLAVLSGGAVRYRFYHRFGLNVREVTIVSTFCAVAFGVSVSLVGMAALVVYPDVVQRTLPLSGQAVRTLSAIALLVSLALLAAGALRQGAIGIGRLRVRIPTPSVLAAQVGYSLGELSLAALALYLLLPEVPGVDFPRFVGLFAAASLAAALSHVPGGVGVFDSVLMASLAAAGAPVPDVAAAVLVYRATYYLGPLLIALVLLCVCGSWRSASEGGGGAVVR